MADPSMRSPGANSWHDLDMIRAPRPLLARLLATVGGDLLRALGPDPDPGATVESIAIFDAADQGVPPAGALVLGVGVGESDVAGVLDRIGSHSAVALVLRLPVDLPDDVLRQADEAGICLLGLSPSVGWHQLITLLETVMSARTEGASGAETLGGFANGDLFGLANAICALIDAPVTIEDRSATVLAFSDRQVEADHIRIETILDRRVPDVYTSADEARGANQAIQRSVGPVYLQPIDVGDDRPTLPRIVVAVRAGDEFLGTIWAVVREPLSPDKNQLLLDASRLVALHLLQMRAENDLAQRVRTDLVAAALQAGTAGRDALQRLGLADRPLVVAAATAQRGADSGALEKPDLQAHSVAQLQRTAAAFSLHLAMSWPGSAVAIMNGLIYAIVPLQRTEQADLALDRTCQQFLRQRAASTPLFIGIGRMSMSPEELLRSRVDAERTARLLSSGIDGRTVARSVDVEVESMLSELRHLAAADGRGPTGAYARLLEHDATRKTTTIETLQVWLNANADITKAAAASHVHPNTFRYRLKRLGEIGRFDLEDADERFALSFQLRLFPPTDFPQRPPDADTH
ncbi:helix-turn-helix domain-containing protein [Kribbella solani]